MSKVSAKEGVDTLPDYRPGASKISGVSEPIKLSSNESSFGPSPAAVQAYHDHAALLNRYPDAGQNELREAIAEVHGLNAERIVCGNGSDELILLIARTFLSPGDEALLSENGFVMSQVHAQSQGANVVFAPEKGYRVDVDALLERVTNKTRFCTIANPNNPTGTYISRAELERLHAGLPEECLLLIDGAYAEYVVNEDFSSGLELAQQFDNVVVTRTFSKIYGLPALRIGWMLCSPEIAASVNKLRSPFNTNAAALATAAAAVRDTEYIATIADKNASELQRISHAMRAAGIEVIPSVANFYLLRFTGPERSGSGADAFLQSRGIIPRPTGMSDDYLRITVGTVDENDAVISALVEYMNS